MREAQRYGDKAGEHLRMARGKYSALPHVVLGFLGLAVTIWMILVLAGWMLLEPPGGTPVFAERRQRDTAALIWICSSAVVALVLCTLVFRDRWKCVEAFASRYCSGLMNLSFLYVPFIAAGYALVRGVRKVTGREVPHPPAEPRAEAEVAVGDSDLFGTIAEGLERAARSQPLNRQSPLQLALAFILAGLILGGLAVFLVVKGRQEERESSPLASEETICPEGSSFCHLPLEVSANDSFRQAGLSVRLEPAQIDVTPKKQDVVMAGTITHQERSELEVLNLGLRLYDAAGTELALIPIKVRQDFMPPLRSGDSAPFYERKPIDAVPRRGELVVVDRHTVPAPAEPKDVKTMTLELPASAAGRFTLAAWLRQRESRKLGIKTSTKALLAIRNDGEGVVRSLQLQLVPRGGPGRDLEPTHPGTVVYQHMPPMYPQEVRVIELSYYVVGEVAEERLVVTEIE